MISKIIAVVFIGLFVLCIRWTKKANNKTTGMGDAGDVFLKVIITIIAGIVALVMSIIALVSFF